MVTMSITQARANLADAIGYAQTSGQPVFLTRHHVPVVALVNMARLEGLLELERQSLATHSAGDRSSLPADECRRRRALMDQSAAEFAEWVKLGQAHPTSAADLYASRPAKQ
ncbi:MAG: type II toxin-antitoxin system Phd/YefM family antitoxin [Propionibacteriaceae bacterium]|jgi:PHD/YefM family antitoxin component YafN of YafNO toxin-antitoxin module|nr:type II toxin-antitoxin system Phd/YefM family antitoxin [Propionibacteriaceae bacterium]